MFEYKLSRGLAVSIINCDPSGLNDEEFKLYESMNFLFIVTDWAEDSTDINDKCDFTGLWDHCVTIETNSPIIINDKDEYIA